jgi:outer membrane protein assembly factor BamB
MRRFYSGVSALTGLLALAAALHLNAYPARAADKTPRFPWPQFLGPDRNGLSRETGLNLDWDKKRPRVLWKVPLGSAFSSLTVVGDRLYTMAKRGPRDMVVCLETATGKEVWAHDAAPTYVDTQKQGQGPRSTPTYHQGKLYCLLPMGELLCLDAASGRRLWEVNTFKAADADNPAGAFFYWGVSPSPLVVGDLVIVQPGGKQDRSVMAFHKDTGAVVWGAGSDPYGYSSPVVITAAGRRQLVCPTGQSVLGLDPVQGTVLWRYPFGNRFNVTCANPLWVNDLLFISAAYGGGCAALELRRDGERLEVREKWKSKKNLQTLFATSIIHEGHIYGCHGDIGAMRLRCLDLGTGKVAWDERADGRYTFLGVQGHLLALAEGGTLRLFELTPKALVVKGALPDLLTYKAWAAPALADGWLYLRDQQHVLCLDLRNP